MGELRSAIDDFVGTDLDELDDAALGEYLREASVQRDRLDAACHRAIRAQDQRAAWKADGAHSQKHWLAENCRLTLGQAARQAETAKRLAALPQTAQAVADGTIGMGQAQVAAQAVRDLPGDAAEGLDQLVVESPEVDPARLRTAVDEYAHRVRPASLAAREERAWRSRRLTVSRTGDGAVAIDGRLDPVSGEAVLTALAPLAAPADAGDTRTPEQRRADALVTLCRRALDGGGLPEVGGVRPHVTVVVPLETLQGKPDAPPAMLDRYGAISGEAARMLACDSGVTRVITVGTSQPIDVGRETRVVTVAQRRGLAVRDGGCIGCRAPVAWCQAHHVRFWTEHQGPTDLENLVLVCWRCHRNIHHQGWQPKRGPDGRWRLGRARLVTPAPQRPAATN